MDAWTANNQVSFGIMLRGNVWHNQFGAYSGDYVAVGALDQEMKAFHKLQNTSLQKLGYVFDNTNRPAQGENYELSIKKTGNLYIVRIGMKPKRSKALTAPFNLRAFIPLEILRLRSEIFNSVKKVKSS